MLAVNGHAKHRQSLCRVGYGKTALSMVLFFHDNNEEIFRFAQNDISTYLSSRYAVRDLSTINIH